MTASRAYLMLIAGREPLEWIVREQRTAFASHGAGQANSLEPGDTLLLYTTRGCFGNPTRDRGRVIGRAAVAALARQARRAPTFGDREYPYVVELSIESLAPFREGVELAPLVPKLRETFPDPATWSARMRRALLPLATRDALVIERELTTVARPYEECVASYLSDRVQTRRA